MTSQVMTTEELRTQRQRDDVEAGFGTYRGFQAMTHMATSLANSTIIPEAFRNTIMVKDRFDNQTKKWIYKPENNPNGVSNCIIALNMAQRLGADPMMIMQNLYLVDGRPSWSSQFIIAAINSSGRYSPLRFDITGGDEEVEIPYAVTEWAYNKETKKREPVESDQVACVKNYKCVAWVIEKATGERLESSPITMELAVKEGWYQKNGSKWQSMPEQMLRYRAASFFGRIYAPDLLMGLRTQEEELDEIIDVTPEVEPEQQAPVTTSSLKASVVKETSKPSIVEDVQPEPTQQEAPPVEEVKKPTSTQVRKEMLDRISGFTSSQDLQAIIPFIQGNEILTDTHKTYVLSAVQQKIDEINKMKAPVVNEIKSISVKNGLIAQIQESKDVAELEEIAKRITESKAQMTNQHHQEVLMSYAQRKEILSQADIFGEEEPKKMSYFDSAMARIANARNQDDINDVFIDPAFDEQDDLTKQKITVAAQKRESEIMG